MFRFDGCQNDEKDELAKAKDPGIGAGGGGGGGLTTDLLLWKKKTALKNVYSEILYYY